MHAVIFAAGKSTRTYPLTLTRPKPLLPVANRPILEHQLDALAGTVDSAVLVVGYRAEMIRERYGDRYGDIALHYVDQKEQLGTGHALLQCAGLVRGPFIAMNGDDIYAAGDIQRLAGQKQAALAQSVADPRLYGVFETDVDGNVVRIVEKPANPVSKLANIGVYKFTPSVFDVLRTVQPSPRGEIEITSAIQSLADAGQFRVVETQGHWLPIGYAWSLLDANQYLLEHFLVEEVRGEINRLADIKGPLAVGQGTVIKAGVVIEGPVIIGERCTIGPNCYIRGATAIGNGCKVGQGVELKNSILMDGASVPHLSYVGDSVIGEKANLGCGTVTANFRHDGKNHQSAIKGELIDTGRRKLGAIVGDHVHTGINTSIYPGRKLWPHTSTLPGSVVQRDIEG